jgi:hypothetical protein
MLHILPYHNPLVLAAMIHEFSILTRGRYEFGVGRGHGWIPTAAGLPLDETSRPRYEEALDLFIAALHEDVVTHHGEYWNVDESHIVPFSGHRFRVILGGTSDRTYDLAAKHGWGVAVPPLLLKVRLVSDWVLVVVLKFRTEPPLSVTAWLVRMPPATWVTVPPLMVSPLPGRVPVAPMFRICWLTMVPPV